MKECGRLACDCGDAVSIFFPLDSLSSAAATCTERASQNGGQPSRPCTEPSNVIDRNNLQLPLHELLAKGSSAVATGLGHVNMLPTKGAIQHRRTSGLNSPDIGRFKLGVGGGKMRAQCCHCTRVHEVFRNTRRFTGLYKNSNCAIFHFQEVGYTIMAALSNTSLYCYV